MKRLSWLAGAAALALLAGCKQDEGAGMNVPATVNGLDANAQIAGADAVVPSVTLQLAGDGLWLKLSDGKNKRSGFGAPRDFAVPMSASAAGEPTGQASNPECGAGPLDSVDFRGGLTLYFQGGKFVGWNVDGRDPSPYTTPGAIGVGSTLKELQASGPVKVEESSIGQEFSAGDLSGLLSSNAPDGKIISLWAGTTCIFR